MQFWALLVDGFRGSRDRKIFWILVGLTACVVLALASIGFHEDRIVFLFGLWDVETDYYDPATPGGRSRITGLMIHRVMDLCLGFAGMLLMIIATASFFPRFLEKGAIDVVLAKPIGRTRLFLYKYCAGLVFVAFQATLFIGATFLVMGLRWGVWAPKYLWSIPLMVLSFSYIYCVSVVVAARTNSTAAAILLSLFSWMLFPVPGSVHLFFHQATEAEDYPRFKTALNVLRWIPPKPQDVPYLAAQWTDAGTKIGTIPEPAPGAAFLTPEEYRQARRIEEEMLRDVSAWSSIGSSLAFEAAVLAWGIWIFHRRDF